MKIITTTPALLGGVPTPVQSAGDLWFAAKAKTIFLHINTLGQPGNPADKLLMWFDETPSGLSNLKTSVASVVAGTSDDEDVVTPAFYPVATKGAECAAICSSLTWADRNLEGGYEYIYLLYSATAGAERYFVSGVLNSSQTLSNDPFGTQGVAQGLISGQAACWDSVYSVGVNPF